MTLDDWQDGPYLFEANGQFFERERPSEAGGAAGLVVPAVRAYLERGRVRFSAARQAFPLSQIVPMEPMDAVGKLLEREALRTHA